MTKSTIPNGHGAPEAVAIIGVSCRFAGSATSPSKLWDMCAGGRAAWSRIPESRFNVNSFYHADGKRQGRTHAIGGHFLTQDVAAFDADFFNLSTEEANAMDPQLRWLLECVYEAIENAGILVEKLAGTDTSVYAGCSGKDYHELQARDPQSMPASFLNGNATAMLSNRVSHFFDLHGPSMAIDTGDSSGLVCLHQGCRSIALGESEISIVAASNAILSPDLYIALSNESTIGADGNCYAWDSRAQGYGRGEGTATLILKPLHAALRDRDHVHAVIKESRLNQNGKTASVTSPSLETQVELIKQCYKRAGLDMADTGYVEAHMTGTATGDLAEAEALARTFGQSRNEGDPVLVGSVKTNIGHTEPVSGLAGIIKTVWALKNKQIAPNLNYETPNPNVPLEEWRITVPTTLLPWPKDKAVRASIHNYSLIGGTNAHVILEAAPGSSSKSNGHASVRTPERSRIFILSAKDPVALKGFATSLSAHIRALPEDEEDFLGDLAFTLSERRSRFSHVATIHAKSISELADRLETSSAKPADVMREKPRLGFVFNGQGAQWHAMGRELVAAYPIYAASVRKADEILRSYGSSWSLLEELSRDAQTTRVSEVDMSQAVTVALQLCLVDLLKSWDITAAAVTSHSSGEIAAGYVFGVLTFAEALGVAFFRDRLAFHNEALKKAAGGMAAAGLGQEEAVKYLSDTPEGRVVVACVNSPGSVTLAGDMKALDVVEKRIQADGIFARKLRVPLAYHSHHMILFAQEYLDILRKILPDKPQSQPLKSLPRYASPVTGELVTSTTALDSEYWVRNLTEPVLFSQSLDTMCFATDGTLEVDAIIEVGPHGALSGPIRQILKARGKELPYVSCLTRGIDAVETMQTLACELIKWGYPVSLLSINSPSGETRALVHDLPSYAWNHTQRYWVESRVSKQIRHNPFKPHELLGSILPGSNGLIPTWRNFLRVNDIPWLVAHQFNGVPVLPSAAYISIAIEAARLLQDPSKPIAAYLLRDVEISSTLEIPSGSTGVEIQLSMRPTEEDWYEFTISSINAADAWTVNCTGYVSTKVDATNVAGERIVSADEFLAPAFQQYGIEPDDLFARMREIGFYHGSAFQNLSDIKVSRKRAVAEVTISEVASGTHSYVIHPTTLDSIIVAAYSNLPRRLRQSSLVVPRSIRSMTVRTEVEGQPDENLLTLAECLKADIHGFTSNMTVLNGDGNELPVIDITDFYAIATPRPVGDQTEQAKKPTTSNLQWEPDVFSSPIPASFVDSLRIKLDEEAEEFEKKILRASLFLVQDAVEELEKASWTIEDVTSPHLGKLYEWMKETISRGESGVLAPRSKVWARAPKGRRHMLFDELGASNNPVEQLTIRVGRQLPKIIRGEVAPLELMKEGGLLEQYYADQPSLRDRSYHQLSQLIKAFSVLRPGADVLEIGAGTGSATKVALDAFGAKAERGTLVSRYTYTEVSEDMVKAAKQRLASWGDVVEYKPMDINQDPLEQSFDAASYDLIIASHTLGTTRSLDQSISHIRKLLRPGGKLFIVEPTKEQANSQLIFGTLQKWWNRGKPFKTSDSNTAVETWNGLLYESGFDGVDIAVGDCEDSGFQSNSLIVATARAEVSYPTSVCIVHIHDILPSKTWTQELSNAIQNLTGKSPEVKALEEIDVSEETLYIFTPEIVTPFVHGLNEISFEKLRKFLIKCRNILWLSSGGATDSLKPVYAQTQGLLRALRQQDRSKRYVHLDFTPSPDESHQWTAENISCILKVIKRSFNANTALEEQEFEFAEKDSAIYVPRVYPDLESKNIKDSRPLQLDNSDATHLIVGGMDGIGRIITSWVMEMGAKNLVVVSQNAETSYDVEDMKALAKADGCNLVIRSCDIADEKSFVALLSDCQDTLPPIRGVIDATPALEDTIFERITYDQWRHGISAKVNSSINLHKHLDALDYFVMLSSVAGVIGNSSKAVHVAGNAFQDALARHRTALQSPAVVLDLPTVKDAEQQQDSDIGAASINVETLLELLESAIRHPLRETPAASQIIVGVPPEAVAEETVVRFDRRFGTLRLATPRRVAAQSSGVAGAGEEEENSLSQLTRGAAGSMTTAEAIDLVVDAIGTKVAAIRSMDRSEIEAGNPLSQYGVDSIVGVELRNWLSGSLGAKVSIFEILQSASLAEFAGVVLSASERLAGLIAA
ncbi:polyketide synthase [Xylaria sp. FL1777]|nr:polyketide synthase [Xylaria sp. FL1777]